MDLPKETFLHLPRTYLKIYEEYSLGKSKIIQEILQKPKMTEWDSSEGVFYRCKIPCFFKLKEFLTIYIIRTLLILTQSSLRRNGYRIGTLLQHTVYHTIFIKVVLFAFEFKAIFFIDFNWSPYIRVPRVYRYTQHAYTFQSYTR